MDDRIVYHEWIGEKESKLRGNTGYWLFIPTDTKFSCRKEGELVLGFHRFRKLKREGKLVFVPFD